MAGGGRDLPAHRPRPPAGQRAVRLQTLDLRLQELGRHRQLADLGLQPVDLGIPGVSRAALQRRLAPGQELVTPAAQLGRGHAQLARDQLQVLAPQEPQHRLLLAPRRHPPPRLGRGPVSASVVGALRRAHAHPNRLVHPHLLAVAYLQRCGNGPTPEMTGETAVPQSDGVNGVRGSAPGIIEGQPWSTMPGSTSRWNGAACAWSMRPAGSSARPRCASEPEALVGFFRQLGLPLARIGLEAGPLSQWLHAGLVGAGLRGGAARDAACQGGALGDDRKDRPQRRARHRPADAHGLVPAGPPQVAAGAGGPGPADRAQAAAGQAAGRRAEHPRHPARLRPQGRRGQQGPVRGPDPRAGRLARPCWSGSSSRCCGRATRCGPSTRRCTASCWRSCARTRSAAG